MEIVVDDCRVCPFLGEEYEQKVCNLITYQGSMWIDDDGFHEMWEKGELPKSCPIRADHVTVSLEKEKNV